MSSLPALGYCQEGKNPLDARDCVPRSIALATGSSAERIYDTLSRLAGWRNIYINGVHKRTYHRYLKGTGWRFRRWKKIPERGTYLVVLQDFRTFGHMTVVIDGVVHDWYDCRPNWEAYLGYYERQQPSCPV